MKKDLSNELYMSSLLKYYELLTNGRVKPDNTNGGTIRESKGESNEIAQVKALFAQIFGLDTEITYFNRSNNNNNSNSKTN